MAMSFANIREDAHVFNKNFASKYAFSSYWLPIVAWESAKNNLSGTNHKKGSK